MSSTVTILELEIQKNVIEISDRGFSKSYINISTHNPINMLNPNRLYTQYKKLYSVVTWKIINFLLFTKCNDEKNGETKQSKKK